MIRGADFDRVQAAAWAGSAQARAEPAQASTTERGSALGHAARGVAARGIPARRGRLGSDRARGQRVRGGSAGIGGTRIRCANSRDHDRGRVHPHMHDPQWQSLLLGQ